MEITKKPLPHWNCVIDQHYISTHQRIKYYFLSVTTQILTNLICITTGQDFNGTKSGKARREHKLRIKARPSGKEWKSEIHERGTQQ